MATEFVQIGSVAFNPAQVVRVAFGDNRVWVDLVASGEIDINSQLIFEGPSARAFKAWWDRTASVWYEDPEYYKEEE